MQLCVKLERHEPPPLSVHWNKKSGLVFLVACFAADGYVRPAQVLTALRQLPCIVTFHFSGVRIMALQIYWGDRT